MAVTVTSLIELLQATPGAVCPRCGDTPDHDPAVHAPVIGSTLERTLAKAGVSCG